MMRSKNSIHRLGAAAVWLAATPLLLAMVAPVDQMCGTTANHTTQNLICGVGTYVAQTSSTDKRKAEDLAEADLLDKLKVDSGVACSVCPDIQPVETCPLNIRLTTGMKTTTYEEIDPGGPTTTNGWKVTVCWSGYYQAICGTCPAPE